MLIRLILYVPQRNHYCVGHIVKKGQLDKDKERERERNLDMATIKIYSAPSYLYRYRSLDGKGLEHEIDALVNSYIFCPTFDQMNDPMEGSHKFGLNLIQQVGFRNQASSIYAERRVIGIASLTETHQHEPMWAYYADQFKGICIGYHTKKLLKALDPDIDLIRMAYNENPPLLARDRNSAIDKAKLTLGTKSVKWMSEREWRLLTLRNGPAEYNSPDPLFRVYLGSRIEPVHEQAIRQALTNFRVPILKMKINRYRMEFSHTGG